MDSYYSKSPTTTTKQPPKAKKISISILVISLPLLYASLLRVPPSSLFRDTTFWFLISNSIILIVAADFASSSTEHTTTGLYDEYVKHNRTRAACPPVLVVEEQVIEQAQDSTPVQPEPADNADQMGSSEEPELAQPDMIREAEKHLKGSDESKLPDKISAVKDCSSTELTQEPEPEPAVVHVKQPRLCERSRSELVETNAEATKNLLLHRSATTTVGEKRRSCGMEESEYWKMSDEELNKRVEEFIRRFNTEIRLQKRQTSAVY